MTDKFALYWLKSLLACRLNSAHLRGRLSRGSLFSTEQTPREMMAAMIW